MWWASKAEAVRLKTIQNGFFEMGLWCYKDRMHVKELKEQPGMRSLEDSKCCKQLEWLGHLIRMDGNRLVSRVWGGSCKGKRTAGRPRWIYSRQEAEDLAGGGLSRFDAL